MEVGVEKLQELYSQIVLDGNEMEKKFQKLGTIHVDELNRKSLSIREPHTCSFKFLAKKFRFSDTIYACIVYVIHISTVLY